VEERKRREEWKGGGVGGRERQGNKGAKEDIPSVSLKNVLANSVAPPLLNVIVNVPFLPVIFIQYPETYTPHTQIIQCTLAHVFSCDVICSKYWLMNLIVY